MVKYISIPTQLLEQFERGNALLLVGAGVNQGLLPSPDEPLTLPCLELDDC